MYLHKCAASSLEHSPAILGLALPLVFQIPRQTRANQSSDRVTNNVCTVVVQRTLDDQVVVTSDLLSCSTSYTFIRVEERPTVDAEICSSDRRLTAAASFTIDVMSACPPTSHTGLYGNSDLLEGENTLASSEST